MDRRMMMQHTDNVIRAFVGKGTSGANIIDNANRALTEPIPFTNGEPITVKWDGWASGVQYTFKNTTPNTTTLDTTGLDFVPTTSIGGSDTGAGAWAATSVELTVAHGVNYTLVPLIFNSSSGYCRLLFAGTDLTSPIPITLSGNLTIQGTTYRLVEAPASEFE